MLIVQKYGGTSVGSIERIRAVASRVLARRRQGHRLVVVVSAMAGETDRLTRLACELGTPARRELDVLLASGEQVSIALLAMALRLAGGDAVSLLGHQIRLLTDSDYSRARIQTLDGSRLTAAVEADTIPVVAGFQGVDEAGDITTLGRGGSDTSAVAIAAALSADICEIYTDVAGVYTADPSLCPQARKIDRITYDEMMELASLGAKVLQIRAVEVASNHGVPLHVRSSFTDEEGTMVVANCQALEEIVVTGVSVDRDQCRLTVTGLDCRPGIQADLFRPLGEAGLVIDMIVQNPPLRDRTNVSFTVPQQDLAQTRALLDPLAAALGADGIDDDDGVAKVSIVGVAMRSHSGVAQKMFDILAIEGIEILMISTSEIKVSCIVADQHAERAVRALHAGFIGD